jgi:hypothetical protein
MSSDFNSTLTQYGIAIPDENLSLKNEGGGYYEYLPGDYVGLIGRFNLSYVNKEKKKCEKGEAGATLSHANLHVLVVKDPEKSIFDTSFQVPKNDKTIPYGRMVYNIYIPLISDRQWQNVNLFKDFTFNGKPELSVISGDKGSESVNLALLSLFVGIPVQFTLEAGTKQGSRFIKKDSFLLKDHQFPTKDLFDRRGKLIDSVFAQLAAILEEAKKKRDSESAGEKVPLSDAANPEDYMGDYTVPSN